MDSSNDRNEKGQFLKGTVPNPKGRPRKKRGINIDTFIQGTEKTIFKRYLERAMESDEVLINLVDRILKNAKSSN